MSEFTPYYILLAISVTILTFVVNSEKFFQGIMLGFFKWLTILLMVFLTLGISNINLDQGVITLQLMITLMLWVQLAIFFILLYRTSSNGKICEIKGMSGSES